MQPKTRLKPPKPPQDQTSKRRLTEAEEIVRAIRSDQVDALVVSGGEGEEIYTLHGTDSHYRALVEEMNEGVLTLSEDGILLYCNRRFAEMLKMPPERIFGAPLAQFVHAADRARAERIFKAGLEQPAKEEITLLASDSQALVARISLRAMTIERVRCLGGVVMDVTEQKQAEEQTRLHAEDWQRRVAELDAINAQLKHKIVEHARAEEALRKSESRFRQLAENAQDLIYRVAFVPERRFEYVSPSVTLITGYTPEDYYADPDLAMKLIHPDDRPVLEAMGSGQLLPNSPVALRWIHKDGHIVWTEQRIVPVVDDSGTLVALEGIVRDITERKHSEEALRASEERFRLALADSHITVFNQDCDLRYTWIYNPVLGVKPEDLLGKTDADLWPTEQAARLDEIKRPALENGKSRRGEVAYWDGAETRVVDLAVEPRHDLGGQIVGITCVAVDVTDRKRSEQALQRANQDLINWAGDLELRNREISQLNEMGDLLQSCLTFEEAYRVIAASARHLLPRHSGALFVLNNSRNLVEAMAIWGDPEAGTFEHVFAPNDCWALRRGRIHAVSDTGRGLLCGHVHRDPAPRSCLCVPMMAQGETLGILYLQSHPVESDSTEGRRMADVESEQRLAVSIAEHVALALSSLRFRETLHRQAIRDPLTGMFNRRYMEESLERELRRATRKQTSVGIVMLDLDDFKHFNDDFGHEVGDAILHAFGDFLQNHIRGGDIACRYGGEEFTLILPETSLEETVERAQQVRLKLKSLQLQHNGRTFGNLSASLGIAVFPQHAETAEEIFSTADVALYRAKAQGRDGVVVAESSVSGSI